jgi:membrane protease YdiL (CAAX protease family)
MTNLKPLPLWQAVLHFVIAGIFFRLSIYNFLPLLIQWGLPAYEAFIVSFLVPLVVLFALAFEFAKLEGVPLTLPDLAQRFRLRRPRLQDFLWVLLAFIVTGVGATLLASTRDWVLSVSWLNPPASFPAILNPVNQNEALPSLLKEWLGGNPQRQWHIIILYAILFFFNQFGEELWWRGIIFPRQQLVHGKWTWLVHGLLWNIFHLPFYPWYLFYGLPVTLGMAFIAQKTENTWMTLLLHSLSNATFFILIISTVLGG